MIHKSYQPSIPLIPYIDRYWYCSSESQVDLFPLFAGTGAELIIHFGTSFSNREGLLPYAHILCPRKVNFISSTEKLEFLAVRFRSGAFRHFNPIGFGELSDKTYSLDDIWKDKGRDLADMLYDVGSIQSKIDILNKFFQSELLIYKRDKDIMDTCISYIYNNFDNVTISLLAKEMNVTVRHFERVFKDEFGITPKKFQRTSRFQSTLKEMLITSAQDPLQIALGKGYYDQSHFIKEFKDLSGLLPSEILRMKVEKTHFYLDKFIPSLKRL